jgi:V/A-type H+-transporting ATPase subunit E
MSNKLEQLTNQLYAEGVDKANKEAEVILKEAQTRADKIIKDAQDKAAQIQKQAHEQAKNDEMNIKSELKLSSNQALNLLKQQISDLVQFKSIDEKVKDAMNDTKFVQSIIELSIKSWAEKNSIDPNIILSDKDQELKTFLEQGIDKALKDKFEVTTDGTIASGFQIAAKDGSYKLSFTDQDFSNLLRSILRKSTVEFLFN